MDEIARVEREAQIVRDAELDRVEREAQIVLDVEVIEQTEIADQSARETMSRDRVRDDPGRDRMRPNIGRMHDVLLPEGAIRVEVPRRDEIPTDIVLPLGSMTPEMVSMVRQIVQEALLADRARVRETDEARTVEWTRVEAEAQIARDSETTRLIEVARVAAEREAELVERVRVAVEREARLVK